MRDPFDRAVRTTARRNSCALVWAQVGVAHLVILGGMGLFRLYQPMSDADFWLLVAISQALVALDNLISIKLTRRMWRPVRAWESGARDEPSTIQAWTALATLPLEYFRRVRKYPFVFGYLPLMLFATWVLKLPWYSFVTLSVAGTAVLLCGVILRSFTMEIASRPVLEEIAKGLPPDFTIEAPDLPRRWRLVAVTVINIITGVVAAGLATRGHHARLTDLGISWLIAVGVSFTLSLELVVLVVRSLGSSLADLQRATERVRAGDYTARVPVVSADETGRLAQSFNTMVKGFDDRERLHEAFGHANKSVGDGLLAVFGAPQRVADHSRRAVAAVLEIVELVRERYGERISVGIGVYTGRVVAGTIGGGRVEFTGIGDAVNTAARVEAATRETGDDTLITEATRARLPNDRFEFEERPPVPLKGKREQVQLWTPRVAVAAGETAGRARSVLAD